MSAGKAPSSLAPPPSAATTSATAETTTATTRALAPGARAGPVAAVAAVTGVAEDKGEGISDEMLKALRREAPAGWKVYKSSTLGKPYWYNKATGETAWRPPTTDKPGLSRDTTGPSGPRGSAGKTVGQSQSRGSGHEGKEAGGGVAGEGAAGVEAGGGGGGEALKKAARTDGGPVVLPKVA